MGAQLRWYMRCVGGFVARVVLVLVLVLVGAAPIVVLWPDLAASFLAASLLVVTLGLENQLGLLGFVEVLVGFFLGCLSLDGVVTL